MSEIRNLAKLLYILYTYQGRIQKFLKEGAQKL